MSQNLQPIFATVNIKVHGCADRKRHGKKHRPENRENVDKDENYWNKAFEQTFNLSKAA